MALTRYAHWDTRFLHPFIEATRNKPFRWGENDCSLFAANAIQSFTGVDLADDFRGKYTDQASAFALVKTVTGGTTVADAAVHCATKHGLTEYTHPLLAKRGDLAVVKNPDGELISGVVGLDGRHVISVGDGGMRFILITNIQRAWQV